MRIPMKSNLLHQFILASSIAICGAFPIVSPMLNAHIDAVGPPPENNIRQIVELDPTLNELPGAIIVGLKRDIFVSFPFLNQVRRYSVNGELLHTANIPAGNDN